MNTTWTYWVTRDSVGGVLSDKCSLWCMRPTRVRHRRRITWVATDARKPGHLGEFSPVAVHSWFSVYPETDLELIRVEQCPTSEMLGRAEKEYAKR